MGSDDNLNALNIQVISSIVSFPYGTGTFQDDDARIHWAQIETEQFWERETMFSHVDWLIWIVQEK